MPLSDSEDTSTPKDMFTSYTGQCATVSSHVLNKLNLNKLLCRTPRSKIK